MTKKSIIIASTIIAIGAATAITKSFSSSKKLKKDLSSIIEDANKKGMKLEFTKKTDICGVISKVVVTYPPDRRADAAITLDRVENIIKHLKKRGVYVVGKDDGIIFIYQ